MWAAPLCEFESILWNCSYCLHTTDNTSSMKNVRIWNIRIEIFAKCRAFIENTTLQNEIAIHYWSIPVFKKADLLIFQQCNMLPIMKLRMITNLNFQLLNYLHLYSALSCTSIIQCMLIVKVPSWENKTKLIRGLNVITMEYD